MPTAVLVLQVLLLSFIVVLSIQLYAGRKLTEASQKLTEKRVSVSYEHVIHHEDGLFRNQVVAS